MMHRRAFAALLVFASLLAAPVARAQTTGPALTVDVGADRHPISPDIYGMAYPDPPWRKEIGLPINRWGGDGTTRYNWQVDGTNAGRRLVLHGGRRATTQPSPQARGPDALVARAKADGGTVLMTVPVIDYVNKAGDWDCSFPVSLFGPQQKVNPYVHPIVNGQHDRRRQRAHAGRHAHRADQGADPPRQRPQHARPAAGVGAAPRRQVRHGGARRRRRSTSWTTSRAAGTTPTATSTRASTGHDDLVSRSLAYAAAIKAADPTAPVLGPGDFLLHYQSEGVPGDGNKEHGGLGQADYYLQQFAAYDKAHGKRLLDYFDEHYYPLGQDGGTDATVWSPRARSGTRPTWRRTGIGKYNGAIDLIPSVPPVGGPVLPRHQGRHQRIRLGRT